MTNGSARLCACLGQGAVWCAAAVALGLACGAGAIALSALVDAAVAASRAAGWLVAALPLLGLATAAAYRVLKVPFDFGTVDAVARMRAGGAVRLAVAPLIAFGTAASALGGASVGKEAGALQIGAAFGSTCARLVRPLHDARDVLEAAGMAAAISALLCAPVCGTLFALELSRASRAKITRPRTLAVPIAAASAFALARLTGAEAPWAQAAFPAFPNVTMQALPGSLAAALGVGLLAALVGVAFSVLIKLAHTLSASIVPAPWARMLVAGALAAAVAVALGGAYGGTGAELVSAALAGEPLPGEAFACKALLTIACVGCGLKGGEIMPVLAIGACLGSACAPVLGADAALLAACGMAALFGACTGCPLAAVALGAEATGVGTLPWATLAVVLAWLPARGLSLYDTFTWLLDLKRRIRRA